VSSHGRGSLSWIPSQPKIQHNADNDRAHDQKRPILGASRRLDIGFIGTHGSPRLVRDQSVNGAWWTLALSFWPTGREATSAFARAEYCSGTITRKRLPGRQPAGTAADTWNLSPIVSMHRENGIPASLKCSATRSASYRYLVAYTNSADPDSVRRVMVPL